MTLESVKDLGDGQIMIALARLEGWKSLPKYPHMIQYTAQMPSGLWSLIPNYPHDLNPLHQLEIARFKTIEEKHMYYEKLTTVCRGTEHSPFSAPARLRAEAILITLGGGHE